MGSYVGIDLHRQRSVVVVLDETATGCRGVGSTTRRRTWPREMTAAGADAEVAMEACWGWYWAADVIAECGAGCIWRIRWGSPVTPTGG